MRTIMVSAYACEPLKGSEQGVGWNWVLQLAKKNNLHVITRANNQEAIEAHLPKDIAEHVTFHYYDTHSFFQKFKKKAKGLYFYYFFWQLGILFLARKLKKEYTFDYSMHLTFGSMWMPTFLPYINIPFIWGPIGGGDGEPYAFLKTLPFWKRILQFIRMVMIKLSFLNPRILIPSYKAKIILVRTQSNLYVIPKKFRSKVRVILETSMEQEIFHFSKERRNCVNDNIRVITTGRLMPSKNILSAIKSFQKIPPSYNITYNIIGSGPEKSKIEKEIVKTKQQNRIKIISEVPRLEILKELSNSDIFLFPSLREGGSWALMEAMAIGLPVICLNWSGMAIITDDASAIRLPVTNPDEMPVDIAKAILKLINNKELRIKMGKAGCKRIKEEFNWDAKGEFMEELFNELEQS